jgi:NADPH-dependent ferric siderophore reductase
MSTVLTMLQKYVTKRPVTQATVVKVEQVSQQFRVIELVCDTPFKTAVLPGDKISITADGKRRCYTTIAVEEDTSTIRLGIFLHGKGPGSAWASSVKVSDVLTLTRPRPSLDLSTVNAPCVLFGDETAFAAARSLQRHLGIKHASRFVFEVDSFKDAQAVVTALELRNTVLIEKCFGNSHIAQLSAATTLALGELEARHLVLTGCAYSIQALRKILSSTEVGYSRGLVKAYWAPSKIGLD